MCCVHTPTPGIVVIISFLAWTRNYKSLCIFTYDLFSGDTRPGVELLLNSAMLREQSRELFIAVCKLVCLNTILYLTFRKASP